MMRVSVATVCLNAEATLEATVASVLAAGPAVAEYLVVDGGSTDGTIELLRRYEPSFGGRMRWVSEPDDGLYYAMNRAIGLAAGTHLLFLGGDDTLVAGALKRLIDEVGDDEGVGLVFSDVVVVEPDGRKRTERGCARPSRIGAIPRSMPACHQASLFSVRAYRDLGGFDTRYRVAADYEFYLRFVEAGLSSRYVAVELAEYSLGGISSTRGLATAREYRRAWIQHGVSPVRAWLRMVRSVANLRAMEVVRKLSRGARRGR